MAVTLKTQKMLWGRAAARCAMPECRRHLVEDVSETDDPTLVGENCHIVAESDGGPRSDPTVPFAERNRYANLILLCRVDHKIIDDNEAIWTVEKLKKLKSSHETWVEQSLGLDRLKLRDDTVYGDYVDEWARRAHLGEWAAWSSYVLGSGQPRIRAEVDKDLEELRGWLLARIWPGRYLELERAFGNFARVLQDFQETLRSRLEPSPRNSMLFTAKFYQIGNWDPPRYERLSRQYDFHVDLVSDLMLELTRAANLLCDQIRRHIAHAYRLAEGHLTVQRGPDIHFQWSEFVTRYSGEEAALERPYPGLEAFYDARSGRDVTIGVGRPDG
jgi:hypothetical protein